MAVRKSCGNEAVTVGPTDLQADILAYLPQIATEITRAISVIKLSKSLDQVSCGSIHGTGFYLEM